MTQEREAEIEQVIVALEIMQDKFAEWFDAEHEEWVMDKKNPDKESRLSHNLRIDHFRLADKCLEEAMEHLQGTCKEEANEKLEN